MIYLGSRYRNYPLPIYVADHIDHAANFHPPILLLLLPFRIRNHSPQYNICTEEWYRSIRPLYAVHAST